MLIRYATIWQPPRHNNSNTMHRLNILPLLLALVLFVGCKQDYYEAGDGEYSLLTANFVEAHAAAHKTIDYVITDEGERLSLQQPQTVSWAAKADSLYRAVLYYNFSGGTTVETVSMKKVSVVSITPKDSIKQGIKTDAVRLESMWLSKSKHYLNAAILVKSGDTDDEKVTHTMGIVAIDTLHNTDNTSTLCLQLYHDQGGVPEYYSQRAYFSIPLQGVANDSVRLSINTPEGVTTKTFSIQ